jgi:hypothetical protein
MIRLLIQVTLIVGKNSYDRFWPVAVIPCTEIYAIPVAAFSR